MRDYENTIELSRYENKENSVNAFLIEKGRKVNLLVPGQDDDAWLYALAGDGSGWNLDHQPSDMIKILSGEAEPPVEDFFEQLDVTLVKISKEYHASLIATAHDNLLLSNPAKYLMSLLKHKKKADF